MPIRDRKTESSPLQSGEVFQQTVSSLVGPQADIEPQIRGIESEAWKAFHDASSILAAPIGDELLKRKSALNGLVSAASDIGHVIGPDATGALKSIRDDLASFLDETAHAGETPKARAVQAFLTAMRADQAEKLIVTSSARSKSDLSEFAILTGAPVETMTVTEFRHRTGTAAQEIGVCSLFSRDAFTNLFDPWPANRVALIGYRHEIETYQRRLNTRSKERSSLQHNSSIIDGLLESGASLAQLRTKDEQPLDEAADDPRFEIARPRRDGIRLRPEVIRGTDDETVRQARLSQFRGTSWAAFTEGFVVPTLEKSDGEMLGRPVLRPADELQSGDRLLLREAGDSDIIRSLAEAAVGPERYKRTLTDAHLWKNELRKRESLGSDITILLRTHGLKRDATTIRYWMRSDSIIGPRSHDDLAIIAEAVGADARSAPWRVCTDAIRDIRGWHLSAGMRLTDMIVSQCQSLDIDAADHEIPIQTPLGLAWLVEVVEFDSKYEEWSYSVVNRLQWTRSRDRERALSIGLSDVLETLGL